MLFWKLSRIGKTSGNVLETTINNQQRWDGWHRMGRGFGKSLVGEESMSSRYSIIITRYVRPSVRGRVCCFACFTLTLACLLCRIDRSIDYFIYCIGPASSLVLLSSYYPCLPACLPHDGGWMDDGWMVYNIMMHQPACVWPCMSRGPTAFAELGRSWQLVVRPFFSKNGGMICRLIDHSAKR